MAIYWLIVAIIGCVFGYNFFAKLQKNDKESDYYSVYMYRVLDLWTDDYIRFIRILNLYLFEKDFAIFASDFVNQNHIVYQTTKTSEFVSSASLYYWSTTATLDSKGFLTHSVQ